MRATDIYALAYEGLRDNFSGFKAPRQQPKGQCSFRCFDELDNFAIAWHSRPNIRKFIGI